jgi:hypothetical protein
MILHGASGQRRCAARHQPGGRVFRGAGNESKTNKNAYDMIHSDTIFTNVHSPRMTSRGGRTKKVGAPALDWQGENTKQATDHPRIRIAFYYLGQEESELFTAG